MRVSTGAPVPANATAVVMVEDTNLITADGSQESKVEITCAPSDGDFIREIGSDVLKGEKIFSKGHVINSNVGDVGLLASLGIMEIKVYSKPTVAILSTGNELTSTDVDPLFGQIRDSNTISLQTILENHGYNVLNLGISKDCTQELHQSIKNGLSKCDVLITTGCVSMGEMDLLKSVLERNLNATIHFGRVNIKPGKPITFSTLDFDSSKKLIFSLPGNPCSAITTLHLFVIPSLRKYSGFTDPNNLAIKVELGHDLILDERPEFVRVFLQHGGNYLVAYSTGNQRSSRLSSFVGCSGLLKLPCRSNECKTLCKGDLVDCFLV